MIEEWKDIEGYEGKYMVSNLGRVKSLNYRNTGKEHILKQGNNGNGYLFVELCLNGKHEKHFTHRLVAKAFIPNPNNLPQVNHKDENKENNCVDNLEFCTQKYNLRYNNKHLRLAKKVGCYKEGKLIKIYNSIISTEEDGFKHSNVSLCCKEKRYKSHHGFQFKYFE